MLITNRDEEESYQVTSSVLLLWSKGLKALINLSKTDKTDKKLMINIIDDIISTCDIWIKYKKTRPWFAVGLPMGSDFNETVVMDLVNIVNNIWFIYLIYLFILFSGATKVTTKEKNVITDIILKYGVSHWAT